MQLNPHYAELNESYLFSTIAHKVADYQKAHLPLRQSLPALNSMGYDDSQDRWLLSSS